MAVYNGGIRFAPDVYYEIKEDGGDITVLRNGEESGGGGTQVMIINTNGLTLDHTWNEIKNAMINGKIPIIQEFFEPVQSYVIYYVAQAANTPDDGYRIDAISAGGGSAQFVSYTTDNPDGYPTTRL